MNRHYSTCVTGDLHAMYVQGGYVQSLAASPDEVMAAYSDNDNVVHM